MRAIRKTVVEVIVLGVLGLALGYGSNAVRGTGSIDPWKNLFRRSGAPAWGSPVATTEADGRDTPSVGGLRSTATSSPAGPEHEYQEIPFDEVVEIFNDPNTEMGVNVWVDARDDSAYEAGHIPGAIQCDHYQLDNFIDSVLEAVSIADKVIVYCNGGDCEDSIYLCTDLVEAGVPHEMIYVYTGGWKEWAGRNMPIATGREE